MSQHETQFKSAARMAGSIDPNIAMLDLTRRLLAQAPTLQGHTRDAHPQLDR